MILKGMSAVNAQASFSLLFSGYIALAFSLMLYQHNLGHSIVHYSKVGLLFLPFVWQKISIDLKCYALIAIVFIISVAISNYFSLYATKNHGGETIMHWALILPFSAICILSRPNINKLFFILFFALIVSFFVALIDLYTGMRRYLGVHGLPIVWGNLSLLTGILCFFIAIKSFVRYSLLLSLSSLFLGIFISAVSMSRGGWVALMMISPFIINEIRLKLPLKVFYSVLILIIIFLVCILASDKIAIGLRFLDVKTEISSYMHNLPGSESTSIGHRFEMWRSCVRAFFANPLLGIGNTGFENWIKQDANFKSQMESSQPHNQFFLLLGCFGLIGTVIFSVLVGSFCYFIRASLTSNKINLPGFLGAILTLAYLDFSLTESFFTHSNIGSAYFIFLSTYLLNVAIHDTKQIDLGRDG